ncbi:hypothetical protein D3C71_2095540 [compost metagenome]
MVNGQDHKLFIHVKKYASHEGILSGLREKVVPDRFITLGHKPLGIQRPSGLEYFLHLFVV